MSLAACRRWNVLQLQYGRGRYKASGPTVAITISMFGISLLPLGSERLAVDRQGCAEVLPAHVNTAVDLCVSGFIWSQLPSEKKTQPAGNPNSLPSTPGQLQESPSPWL
ncbi:hypothetical protein EK904_012080 [Melospiza melodia maxima]|nr:hypothetical protein EK904_012080 [Melospiza melodia maxima]